MTTMPLLERAGRLSDEIRAEAAKVDPVKVAFVVLMVPFVVLGYLAAWVLKLVWAVVSFAGVAFLVGYRNAAGPNLTEIGQRLKRPGS